MRKEIELILLAVLVDKNEQEVSRISEILNYDMDWIYIGGILVNHRLAGYFYDGLNEVQKSKVPKEISEIFKLIIDAQYRRQSYVNREVDCINKELLKSKIRFAGLKGVIFGAMLYSKGNRRSNDIDLLVHEDDLTALDAALRSLGYIQSSLPNGRLIEATKKEKMLQRLNYHDLVPYIKHIDEIGFFEVDINFLFDGKENQIDDLVFEDGLQRYNGVDYSIMGFSPYMNLAFLCVHFYREATNSLWTNDKRDLTLYKLVDLINYIRRVKCELDVERLKLIFDRLNIAHKCYYVFLTLEEFYQDLFVKQMVSILSTVNKDKIGYIYDNAKKKYIERERSFFDSIFG